MFVKFENVKFKNILSYGNNENEISFEHGMTLISGKNGNGKCVRSNTTIRIKFENDEIENKWCDGYSRDSVLFRYGNVLTNVGSVAKFYREHPETIGKLSVLTRFGFKTIEFASVTSFDSDIIRVTTKNKMIETSPDHLLFVNNKWTQVKFIKKGDVLSTDSGDELVESTHILNFKEDLYDLQVSEVHEFYANGIVSHNSSMIDALSFCLYGKPYRKVKINDLINRKNKKKLYTECNFIIGDDKYKIVRTLLPSSIEIWKNGTELEKLSSKKLNQEEINKLIGIDHNLFRQIIALSINYNKAFLALEIAEKRDIIESIFNIKVFAEMLKKLKTNNTNLKVQNQVNLSQISILESTIKTLQTQIKNIQKTRTTFDSDKKAAVDSLKAQFEQKKIEYKDLMDENKKIQEKIDELRNSLDSLDFSAEVGELNSTIKFSEKKYLENCEKIELLSFNVVCPECGSELTEEHKASELVKLNSSNETLKQEMLSAKEKKSVLANRYRINEDKKQEISGLEKKLSSNTNSITHLKTDVKRLVSDIEREQNRTFDFDDASLISDYDNKKIDYTNVYEDYTKVSEDIKYNDFAVNILSDQGIKAFFYKRLVPILNEKINHYLDIFELPIQINFNDMMEEYINMIGSKEYIPYMSFSEGEKKRIDIAIMLSFIDTTKVISNWNCNLLAFDEILDTSTDSDGLDKIMGAVKQMTIDQTDLCCYIISHRDNDHENYTRKINVKKVGGFSFIHT